MNNEVIKGDIVKYKDGWMRVMSVFKDTVNLTGVFGSKPTVKNVSKSEVTPDYDNWVKNWEKSETYKCM